jgi:hypothetical protein
MLALKYIRLRPHVPHDLERFLFTLAPVSHRELAAGHATTHTPISAGFVVFEFNVVRTYGCSDSLCLTPDPDDARLISALAATTHRLTTEPSSVSQPR